MIVHYNINLYFCIEIETYLFAKDKDLNQIYGSPLSHLKEKQLENDKLRRINLFQFQVFAWGFGILVILIVSGIVSKIRKIVAT